MREIYFFMTELMLADPLVKMLRMPRVQRAKEAKRVAGLQVLKGGTITYLGR